MTFYKYAGMYTTYHAHPDGADCYSIIQLLTPPPPALKKRPKFPSCIITGRRRKPKVARLNAIHLHKSCAARAEDKNNKTRRASALPHRHLNLVYH